MNRTTKIAIVLAGYSLSVGAAVLAGYAYEWAVNKPGVDTSGGMYAFGSMMQILAAFGVAALVPTGLAFWWIRKSDAAWRILSWLGLALAVTGPLFAVFFTIFGNSKTHHPELGDLALVGIIRLAVAPFIAVALVVAAILARGRQAKVLLWIAAGIEITLCVVGAAKFLPHL